MADWKITDKSAVITPATTDVFPVSQSGIVKKITTAQILSLLTPTNLNLVDLSWKADTNTWTYASASANFPEYTFTINADARGYIVVGQKLKLTQTTVKYFIVTKVSAYSGSATTITIYGGGTQAAPSYALADEAITSPYYATTYRPLDFPIGQDTWSTIYTSANNCYKTSPTANTWYGGTNAWTSGAVITPYVGTGLWDISYSCILYESNGWAYKVTLSSSNNSESNSDLTNYIYHYYNPLHMPIYKLKELILTTTTQFWLMVMTVGGTPDSGIRGDLNTTIIKAKCLYV